MAGLIKIEAVSKFSIILAIFLLIPSVFLAEETLTITTYYPSPYGVYREMRAKRIAIGDTYYDAAEMPWEETDGDGGDIDYLSDLVVEGNVGIGTTSPESRLEITGNDSYGVGIKLNPTASGGGIWWLFAPTTSAGADRAGHLDFTTGTALSDVRISMNRSGNVGIGTTSAISKLTVKSDGSPYNAGVFIGGSTAFSILPYNGLVHLSAGTYYDNGTWKYYRSAGASIFGINETSGTVWYSGTGDSYSNVASGVTLWNASGTWVGSSSRKLKENFTKLNPDDLLNKINQLDVTRWNFKSEGKAVTHIGPVAEDFYRIFKTGDAEDHLATIDTAGVSLAGVKALSGRARSQQQQIEEQQKQIDDLKQIVAFLGQEISKIKKQDNKE